MSADLALAKVRPWGSTLRPVTVGRSHIMFQAPDGQLWDSVRDAFWGQQLNMCMCMCEDHDDQLELMRATLKCVAEEMHRIDPEAMTAALFGASEMFLRHYLLDLASRNLLEHEATVIKHARLTSLGWSVLAMLEATKLVIVDQTNTTHSRAAAIQRGERSLLIN